MIDITWKKDEIASYKLAELKSGESFVLKEDDKKEKTIFIKTDEYKERTTSYQCIVVSLGGVLLEYQQDTKVYKVDLDCMARLNQTKEMQF